MSGRGHARERQVRDWLQERDWVVVRAAGSLGVADLVAGKAGEPTRLVEVKSTAQGPYERFTPADRNSLAQHAAWAGWTAWLAWWPPRGKLRWIPQNEWPGGNPGAADAYAEARAIGRAAALWAAASPAEERP